MWWRLAEGVLEHLELYQKDLTDEDRVLVADMVERCAQIAGCHGLTYFSANRNWLGGGTPDETRLLRALLPSLKNLWHGVRWHAAFDPCFRDICAPHLEVLDVELDDEAFPSLEVLETAPALKEIVYFADIGTDAAASQPIIAALHRGVGLRNLKDIQLHDCMIGDAHFINFLDALKGSGCAEQMLHLTFHDCEIGVEGARALANLLRGDGLLALETLTLDRNDSIGDEGAVALANALCEAPRTLLEELNWHFIGMGDALG